jgi:uncharacterized membrane protein YecN with MAPEG domain
MWVLDCTFDPLQSIGSIDVFGRVRNAFGVYHRDGIFIASRVMHLLGAMRTHPASGRAVSIAVAPAVRCGDRSIHK